MKTNRLILMLVGAAAVFAACEKDAFQEDNVTEPAAGKALVKFFHFGVNGPGVNFYANDRKLTATLSTTGAESTSGTTYSVAAAGGFYTSVEPGQYTLTGRIAATVDKDLAIAAIPATLAADRMYSFYLSGLYNTTTKSQDAFVIEDELPEFDFDVACVRFVNAIHNSQPMALYIRNTANNTESKIDTEVAYKSGSDFFCGPPGVYDLFTRTAGSATNAISRAGITFAPGRVYTIASRGDITVTSTTATNRPFLDNTANR